MQMYQTWVQAQGQVTSLHTAISFVVAIYERPGGLEICALSLRHLCPAHSPVGSWSHPRLQNLLNGITDTNKLKRP